MPDRYMIKHNNWSTEVNLWSGKSSYYNPLTLLYLVGPSNN